jgi:hypothetical protein
MQGQACLLTILAACRCAAAVTQLVHSPLLLNPCLPTRMALLFVDHNPGLHVMLRCRCTWW